MPPRKKIKHIDDDKLLQVPVLDGVGEHKKVGRRGGRATANGRKVPPAYGIENRIYRTFGKSGWAVCQKGDKGAAVDSYVFRYAKYVGFLGDEESQILLDSSANARSGNEFIFKELEDSNSTDQIIERFARFELFCLKAFPTSEYAGFLKKCACVEASTNKLSFVLPSHVIVKAYMEHLRSTPTILDNTDDVIDNSSSDQNVSIACTGRQLKAGSISVLLNCITSASLRFHHVPYRMTHDMQRVLKKWVSDDGITQTPSFDPYYSLPLLFDTLFDKKN